MRKIITLMTLLLSLQCMAQNYSLIPLDKDDKICSDRHKWIDDKIFLFSGIGVLAAIMPQDSSEDLLANFQKLTLIEQFQISTMMVNLQSSEKMSLFFSPYNRVRRIVAKNPKKILDYDNFSEEFFSIKNHLLFHTFIKHLDENELFRKDFYRQVRKKSTILTQKDKSTNEHEIYFVADMIILACDKMIQHSKGEEREKILNFIVDLINNTHSKELKSTFSFSFLQYFSKTHFDKLQTTEYAYLMGLPTVLYSGNFVDVIPVYYQIFNNNSSLEHSDSYSVKQNLSLYFPKEKIGDIYKFINYIHKYQTHISFDNQNKTYEIKGVENE